MEKYLNTNDVPLEDIDLIIKSPGIYNLIVPFIEEANRRNIEVITDIELAYRDFLLQIIIIAITGTNGKTTTTTLNREKFFKDASYNT